MSEPAPLQRQSNGDVLLPAEAAQFLLRELNRLQSLLGREQGLRMEEVGRMETVRETTYRQEFVDKLSATVGIKADAVQAVALPSSIHAVNHEEPIARIVWLREWLDTPSQPGGDEAARTIGLQRRACLRQEPGAFSAFIRQDIDPIVQSWVEFARSRLPPARHLSSRELQDHAKVLLLSIADDIEADQSDTEQHAKGRGERPENAPALTRSARDHARHRFEQGFMLTEMVAQYRALRASVQRHWAVREQAQDLALALQLLRFHEAMDQGLTESIDCFSQQLEISRMRMRLGMGMPLAPTRGGLGGVCQAVVEELQAFHPDRNLQLQCTGHLEGDWDLQRIGQMTSNLVSNALQHGAHDQPVRVTVDDAGAQAVISVHNDGPAMSEQVRKTLFEPLKRVLPADDSHEGSSGLGLGLYIAHQIAQAHEGDIRVDSAEDRGTTFTVHLPKHAPDLQAPPLQS